MEYRTDLIDELIVCLDNPSNDYDQKLFVNLFQPILSSNAVLLYNTLCGLVTYGNLESEKIDHKQILKNLKFNNIETFIEARSELEAFGLIETYVKADEINLFMLVIKRLPTAYQFFNNAVLSTLLEREIGIDALNDLAAVYLIHRYDINTFENVTKSIDEVFNITDTKIGESSTWWIDTSYSGIKCANEHFDYELFNILVDAQKIVPDEIRKSKELYDNINRLAWIFNLETEKMVDALRLSTINNIVNYDLLRENCKKLLNNADQKFVLKPKEVQTQSTSKIIEMLNKISPSELVINQTHTALTPGEIAMFDEILVKTNVGRGVLNCVILYVLNAKNGEIPTKNYFIKILNTWIRKGIKTTDDALKFINGESTATNTKDKNPEWYNEYKKNLDKKPEPSTTSESDEATMAELAEFFNNQNK